MKPTCRVAILALGLLVAVAANNGLQFASAQSNSEPLQLSMHTESINYTITNQSGSLWAKIDGYYPINITGADIGVLPMLYPMPPNSTNIHIYLNNQELSWSNYTETHSGALHETAIGDWWMIYSILENFSDSFELRIHYEHPILQVNGSCIFLYDLNIADYLSPQTPDSTAYFTVNFQTAFSEVHVYTASVGSSASQWQTKNFELTNQKISFEMHSSFGVSLPSDLAVVFSAREGSNADRTALFLPDLVVPIVIDIILVVVLLFVKRKSLTSCFSSKKSAN
jgi:hypothetical protein